MQSYYLWKVIFKKGYSEETLSYDLFIKHIITLFRCLAFLSFKIAVLCLFEFGYICFRFFCDTHFTPVYSEIWVEIKLLPHQINRPTCTVDTMERSVLLVWAEWGCNIRNDHYLRLISGNDFWYDLSICLINIYYISRFSVAWISWKHLWEKFFLWSSFICMITRPVEFCFWHIDALGYFILVPIVIVI